MTTGVSRMDYGKGLDTFIEQVAASEITCELIKEDYECSHQEARMMAWFSEPYGQLEYPLNPECLTLRGLQRAQVFAESGHESTDMPEEHEQLRPLRTARPPSKEEFRCLRSRPVRVTANMVSNTVKPRTRAVSEKENNPGQPISRPKPRKVGVRALS